MKRLLTFVLAALALAIAAPAFTNTAVAAGKDEVATTKPEAAMDAAMHDKGTDMKAHKGKHHHKGKKAAKSEEKTDKMDKKSEKKAEKKADKKMEEKK